MIEKRSISSDTLSDLKTNVASDASGMPFYPKQDTRQLRILLVGSDNPHRTMYYRFFSDNGYESCIPAVWEEAHATFETYKPDIILVCAQTDSGFDPSIFESFVDEQQPVEIIIVTDSAELKSSLDTLPLCVCEILLAPVCADMLETAIKCAHERLLKHRLEKSFYAQFEALFERTYPPDTIADVVDKKIVQGIVHNLSGPLSIITGNAQLLENSLMQTESALQHASRDTVEMICFNFLRTVQTMCHYVKNLSASGDKMKHIITSLISKWKKEHAAKIEMVNINDFMRLELEYLESNLNFKNHILKEYCFDETIAALPARYIDFAQVFENLVMNALDAMHDAPFKKLSIRTRQDNSRIYIEIEDTGCGMDEETRQRIFEPFFSTKERHPSPETQHGGTGLGLYNCMNLMRPYRAHLQYVSEKGQGTTVIWSIPKSGLSEEDQHSPAHQRRF